MPGQDILIVSAFDGAFADYGLRMFRSVRHWHPDVRCIFADWGDMPRMDELRQLGVEPLTADLSRLPRKNPRFRDLMLWEFVKILPWRWLVWIDADTLVLRPIDKLWSHTDADFIGHPDRNERGLILRCSYDCNRWQCVEGDRMLKFAAGVWATQNRALLYDCQQRVVNRQHRGRDSDVLTAAVYYNLLHARQLNGHYWNFGRQLIETALYDVEKQRVYYEFEGIRYETFVAAFSRVPVNGVDVRQTSPAIEQFYQEVICCPTI